MNHSLKDIIKKLQTLINLTGEHLKLKQVAVVNGISVEVKNIPTNSSELS